MLDFGFYNMDCLDGMKEFPDGYFDLAICDPPYGDGGGHFLRQDGSRFGGRFDRYKDSESGGVHRTGGTWASKYGKKIIAWDTAPTQEYFDELFRVSRNQIIWGGNYFQLPPTRCFIVWRKLTISEKFSMAMCEYAWTSFNSNAKLFECVPQGKDRWHPTAKPLQLYKWLLNNYAKDGDTILDTHVGSASSLIACRETGHKYVGFEIDPEYYRLAKKRLEYAEAQTNIFDFIGIENG